MSALSIQVPFPVFQDRDGQPLDNGYIWIGQPNLNPQTNPVVAYYDDALTIVATQPLRTINGYVSRAGTPAQVYVDAVNFSILVQDSNGSMVYNFPEGTGISPNASGVVFTGFKGQVGFVSDIADDDGADWIGFDPAGASAVARSAQDKMRDSVSVKDFGAVGDGVADDTAAVQAAITYAVSRTASAGTPGSGYLDIHVPIGLYKITSTITLPGEGSFRFVGEGHIYHMSGFLQGFAGDLFTCSSGNLTTRFVNVLFQGNKTAYVGNYSAVKTTQDAVHAGFEKVVARDFGGTAISLANAFDCVFDDLIVAYNKGGGFKTTGGAGNKFGVICTQVNLGFGLEIGGVGNSGGPFFLEGDLVDNNPAGLNLNNRALKITGSDNFFIGGTLLTSTTNDKVPIEINGERNVWVAVSAAGKGTSTNWVTLGSGANNCRVGGGLQTAITGDATAINTCINDFSGPLYPLSNGEMFFSKGSSSSGTGNGLHVGFDTVNGRGYLRATEPGVANRPLDLSGSYVAFRAPLGSDQTATASALGTVVRKLAITNEAGGVLGFIPIYNTIT